MRFSDRRSAPSLSFYDRRRRAMLRNLMFIFWIAVASTIVLLAADLGKENYKPKEGYVPDEKTAIRIAVAVWIPIYGEKQIEEEKPYHATLSNGVWYVMGSLPKPTPRYVVAGGVAVAEIAKDDGRILRVIHYQ
jgi:NTF2 fold immunity protein